MFSNLLRYWHIYSSYVQEIGIKNEEGKDGNIQNRLFTFLVIYGLPLGLLSLIPSVIVEYRMGELFIAFADIVGMSLIILLTLNRNVGFELRKYFVAGMLMLFSVMKIATLGSFEVGSTYLLAFSIFISLSFSRKLAYVSIIANLTICVGFAFLIRFKLFNSAILDRYTFETWSIYALNFLVVDLVLVMLVCLVIKDMERAIQKSEGLFERLQQEAIMTLKRKQLLEESEIHYRSLFLLNPLPILIYNTANADILQVNIAAVKRYGYTEAEFLKMSIQTIFSVGIRNQTSSLQEIKYENSIGSQTVSMHYPKNSKPFIADVSYSNISFMGSDSRLCIVRDITSDIEFTEAIQRKNEMLNEIAFMQSHFVRAPLARILGLVDLLSKSSAIGEEDKQILTYLLDSAAELDRIIKSIVDHTGNSVEK
ncbi:PAS domain S-box protein [Pedobacter sp. MC2016-24]|uniref:PAS domain S-box protein n=1 Tax=Pedobacter sp. MC2016-24 TaxID=2780090 RepID=UPI0018818C27|nr:PAS domain S-box protein [Pedobacter sp. MC2016-24]MBE9601582.1 PAS domain S-box protein [Pedobacter sp. MC2016-24]